MKILLLIFVVFIVCLYYIFLGPIPVWLFISFIGLAYIILIKQAKWSKKVFTDNRQIILPWLLFSVYSFFRDYAVIESGFDTEILLNIFTLLLFLCGLQLAFRNSLKSFIFVFAIAILIQSVVAIFQAAGSKFAWSIPDILNEFSKGVKTKYTIEGKEEFNGRVRGISTFIHIFSPLIASSAIFFFILLRERIVEFTAKERIFYNCVAAISLLATALTFSRSVIISGGFIILASLFFSQSTGFSKFRNIMLLLLSLGAIVYAISNENIQASNRLTNFGSQFNSDNKRFGSYEYATKLIKQDPFFGVSTFGTQDYEIAIHSVPLKTLAAYGIIGFLLYTLVIINFARKILKGLFQNRNSTLKKYALIAGCWFFVCIVDSIFHTSGIMAKNIYEMGIGGILFGNFTRIKAYGAV